MRIIRTAEWSGSHARNEGRLGFLIAGRSRPKWGIFLRRLLLDDGIEHFHYKFLFSPGESSDLFDLSM